MMKVSKFGLSIIAIEAFMKKPKKKGKNGDTRAHNNGTQKIRKCA